MCVVQTPGPALLTDPLIEVSFLYYCLSHAIYHPLCVSRCSNWSTSLRAYVMISVLTVKEELHC